jgi:hypothetical protein
MVDAGNIKANTASGLIAMEQVKAATYEIRLELIAPDADPVTKQKAQKAEKLAQELSDLLYQIECSLEG